ncbi:hypothetical protein FH692_03585 [Streptococcus suis]|uniref:Uncharacterized protein n=1 Tax=Streptococcus suis TaxID=1307 RepID=A0A540UX86_STRSU|nr:hypothetical protein [Streptococcus suis]TQE89099.1 hypothetical protein FH692_03585 [Streptococcus suis]
MVQIVRLGNCTISDLSVIFTFKKGEHVYPLFSSSFNEKYPQN